jgi:hypothetical protein
VASPWLQHNLKGEAMVNALRKKWFVTILSVVVALSVPTMALACAGWGGGEEEAGIDLTPDSYRFVHLESKAFTVKSYRFSSTTISSISVNAPDDYTINDPNNCKGKTLSYLGSCQFSVTGDPSSTHWASLSVTGKNSGGTVVAWDVSPLNDY